MAMRIQPEDAARPRRPEAQRILFGKNRLADAAEAAQLHDGTGLARKHRIACAGKRVVQCPERRAPAYEPVRTGELAPVVQRLPERRRAAIANR